MTCGSSSGRTTPALARSVGPRHRADRELISISRLEPAPPRGVGGIREIHGGPGKSGNSHGSPSARLHPVHLSPRESEILRHIAAGHTTKEVAAELNIAESTAERHIANIH